jgi:hypothetical protein
MRIGEPQSKLAQWDRCVTIPNGEMYETLVHNLLDKPLDTGRLFYAKLRNAVPRNVSIEVYWNHFDNELTGVMAGRQAEYAVTFEDPVMARTDKIVYIEAIVQEFKEEAQSWQQSQSLDAGQQDSSVRRR